jgi:hypothetical protein
MAPLLDRKYEKFLGGPTQQHQTRIHVTMDRRGAITMNAKCYRELGQPPAANLYFSRADDTIAIEPVHSNHMPTAFPFRSNSSARYLNAAPFCRHFRIKLDSTQRFIHPEIRDGALHLKLSETVTIKRERVNKNAK